MNIEITITNANPLEQKAMKQQLDAANELRQSDGLSLYPRFEDKAAAEIALQLSAQAETIGRAEIELLAPLGLVLTQLPDASRQKVISALITEAEANDIDVSALVPPNP